MPFRLWACMGRRDHVLDEVQRYWGILPLQPILGLKLLLTGFVWTIAPKQLVMHGLWVVGQQNVDISDTLHLRDVAMATTFWLSMDYNFGCIIASDTLFNSRGDFLGSSYAMKWQHSRFRRSKGGCHGNHFLAFYIYAVQIGATWWIRLSRLYAVAMRPRVKLLWALTIATHYTCSSMM